MPARIHTLPERSRLKDRGSGSKDHRDGAKEHRARAKVDREETKDHREADIGSSQRDESASRANEGASQGNDVPTADDVVGARADDVSAERSVLGTRVRVSMGRGSVKDRYGRGTVRYDSFRNRRRRGLSAGCAHAPPPLHAYRERAGRCGAHAPGGRDGMLLRSAASAGQGSLPRAPDQAPRHSG